MAGFFLLPTRIWEITIGALVALHLKQAGEAEGRLPMRQWASIAGLAGIIASVFLLKKTTPFPGIYALPPTLGTALLILFARSDTLVGKMLGNRIPVLIGLISYSAYLWHQSLFAIVRYRFTSPPTPVMSGLVVGTFGLAWISWRFVEKPFRVRTSIARKKIFGWSIAISIAFVSFGTISARLFSGYGEEAKVARALSTRKAVFMGNVDERKFVKYRIDYESLSPDTIVLGSSRVMQIGEKISFPRMLNRAVSGASVEDDLAIGTRALRRFKPSRIPIGADPWLFNAKSGQDRWTTLEEDYADGMNSLGLARPESTKNSSANHEDVFDAWFVRVGSRIYDAVNRSDYEVENDFPESKDKIRRDGSRVYNVFYATESQTEIRQGLDGLLKYSMNPYVFSQEAKETFESLVRNYSSKFKVVLVLSPYHPELYARIKRERKIYLDLEADFRDLALKYGIKIVGSYDPFRAGCREDEFYDVMHPKESCMAKVLASAP